MKRWKLQCLTSICAALLLPVALGCDVDVKDPGEAPEVDVEPGEAPDVDVRTPDVDVDTKEKDVTVPDVDVESERKTIEVPDVDVDLPDESDNE